jgi:hypothetical protein
MFVFLAVDSTSTTLNPIVDPDLSVLDHAIFHPAGHAAVGATSADLHSSTVSTTIVAFNSPLTDL